MTWKCKVCHEKNFERKDRKINSKKILVCPTCNTLSFERVIVSDLQRLISKNIKRFKNKTYSSRQNKVFSVNKYEHYKMLISSARAKIVELENAKS